MSMTLTSTARMGMRLAENPKVEWNDLKGEDTGQQ